MILYMVGKLAPNSPHFTRGLVKYVPGRGYFRAVPSQNGDKFATSPPPPIVERLGISCVSEATVYALQKKRFPGVDVVQPYDGEQHQVVLADGQTVPIERQTCSLTATIMTRWAQ